MTTAHDPTAMAGSEAGVRGLLARRARCLWEKDATGLVELYAAGIVKFDLAPPLVEAGPEVTDTAGWESWFATWEGPIGLEITRLAVDVEGSLALCHSLDRLWGTKVGGHPEQLWLRSTLGLRNIGGKWLIIHQHSSVPFLMDGSGLAALTLQP
ncbi:MAG: YybH family protein [Candidatus Dormibacteria bacterium]